MDSETLSPIDRLLAEHACQRLILDFMRRLDLGRPSSVAELFTEDGVWEWPDGGRRVQGRAALGDYFGSRPADRLSRRMCTNILVDVESASVAVATTYFATYRVDGYTEGTMIPARLPVNVGHYEDTFRLVDGSWLLARRKLVLPFGGPTEQLAPVGEGGSAAAVS